MSTITKFVEIGLGVILAGILVIMVGRTITAGSDFEEQTFKSVNDSYLSTVNKGIESLISYDKSVPVTTIYATLVQEKESVQSLELNYYIKDNNNQLVLTTQNIDFTRGGVVNGTTLNSDAYRTYTIGQLRYLFAERAKVEGSLDEDTDSYDLTITQESRDFQSTNVSN